MTVRHLWQEAHLDRLSATRTYKVQNGKDKIVAEQVVVMEYTAPSTETFTSSSEKGSGFVLHHVFQRLMEDEKNRVRANKDPDSLITPENYTFEMVGTERIGSSDCSVFHAVPKHRQTDLFEGKIWIDNNDFAIVKITGHLAKSPSFWITQVDFFRQGDADHRLPALCGQWIGSASVFLLSSTRRRGRSAAGPSDVCKMKLERFL
jgi:hypothetical protein